jgi:hypothetical protein
MEKRKETKPRTIYREFDYGGIYPSTLGYHDPLGADKRTEREKIEAFLSAVESDNDKFLSNVFGDGHRQNLIRVLYRAIMRERLRREKLEDMPKLAEDRPELGEWADRVVADLPEAAKQHLEDNALLRRNIPLVRQALDCGDTARAVSLALTIGMCDMRIWARERRDQAAMRGKKQLDDARAGGKSRRKLTDEEKSAALRERDQLVANGHSKNDASHLIGPKFEVSYKTIERLK